MNPVNILYIGRHAAIKDIVVRLINNQEHWFAIGALTDEEAKQAWHQNDFDMILLGNGIEQPCETALCTYFKAAKPDIIIIQHYGGGSGLLYNEIMEALHKHQGTTI